MTALHWSCSKGHLDAVKLLIEFRAFPNNMEFTEDRYYTFCIDFWELIVVKNIFWKYGPVADQKTTQRLN